jgi:hypothetical protein
MGTYRENPAVSPGMPKIDRKPPETRRQTWNRVSLTTLCDTLSSDFLPFRTVRQYISVV